MNKDDMLAALRPLPEHSYPVPWRLAEVKGRHQVIVCAEGNYVAEVPNEWLGLAQLIVDAVHEFAGYEDPEDAPGVDYRPWED